MFYNKSLATNLAIIFWFNWNSENCRCKNFTEAISSKENDCLPQTLFPKISLKNYERKH